MKKAMWWFAILALLAAPAAAQIKTSPGEERREKVVPK